MVIINVLEQTRQKLQVDAFMLQGKGQMRRESILRAHGFEISFLAYAIRFIRMAFASDVAFHGQWLGCQYTIAC